ncbi:endonuclease/exonuclease/phosphatase family protein [Verrucomicrobiaceae bacterium 227]
MPNRRSWRLVPLTLLASSLTLHLITLILYVRLPLKFAAFTVFPIWVWGVIGLILGSIAFLFYRARFSLILILVWIFTVLLFSDEARSLGRIGIETIETGPPPNYAGSSVLRVVTLNCAGHIDPTEAVKDYHPDIVFVQEMPHAYHLKRLTDKLFNGHGDYRYSATKRCAVIVRGKIVDEEIIPKYRGQLLTVNMPSGRRIQLLNVHLQPAATNLRLYSRSCWREHSSNRRLRQIELTYALQSLKQKTEYPRIPAIIAGDFNAPANDAVYKILEPAFTDAFNEVGSGWGNTYHRAMPLLRIDHIYSSDKLIPVRARAIKSSKSDHRMVVADYVFR